MTKIDKDINILMNQALKESNEYLEMYELELKKYTNNLQEIENNKLLYLKEDFSKYEVKKREILCNIKKYKERIEEEKRIIESLKKICINNV